MTIISEHKKLNEDKNKLTSDLIKDNRKLINETGQIIELLNLYNNKSLNRN